MNIDRDLALALLRQMMRIRRFRGEMRRALQRGQNPRLPASLHRRRGDRHRRDARIPARRRDPRHLPRARPCTGAAASPPARSWRRCTARPKAAVMTWRFDAPVRRRDPVLWRQRDRRRALPLAVGFALADKLQGKARVTACFFGEGAMAEGEFHESMNLAAL